MWGEIDNMDDYISFDEVEKLFGRHKKKKKKISKKSSTNRGHEDKPAPVESVFGDELRQMEIGLRGLKQIGYETSDSVIEAINNIDS